MRDGLTSEEYCAKVEQDPGSYAPLQSSTLVCFGSTKGRQIESAEVLRPRSSQGKLKSYSQAIHNA
jgi:hypothetical protein